MSWETTPYMSALVLGLAIPLAGIFFLCKFKHISGYKFGIAFFSACFVWIFCYYFELLSTSGQYKMLWSQIKYLGVVTVPVSFFMLSLYYSGYSKWITGKKIAVFCVIPLVTIILVSTNRFHNLMWTAWQLQPGNIISYLGKEYGIWFWVWTAFAYLSFLVSYFFLAKLLLKGPRIFRNHAVVMMVTITLPFLFNLMDISEIFAVSGFQNTPLALTLGSTVLFYGFIKLKVGDFIPMNIEPEIENNKDMVIAADTKNRIFYANTMAAQCLDTEALIGKDLSSVLGTVPVDWKSTRFETIQEVHLKNLPQIFSLSINPYLNMDKKIIGRILIFTDITEQKTAERRYRSIFENSLDGIFRMDMDGNYIQANASLLDMFGCRDKSELPVIVPEPDFSSGNPGKQSFALELAKKDGKKIWVEASLWQVKDPGGDLFIEGILRDITSRKKSEAKIHYLSFHDKLTKLYNRNFFEEELKRLDSERLRPISIIIGDVNGLKLVNDTFGHKQGDKLLADISRILKSCFRREDILARWGGDEFIAILPHTSHSHAQKIIQRIKQQCAEESCRQLTLSISLGCAAKEKPGQNMHDIIKEAEDRMYRHKLIENKSTRSRIISSLEKTLEERDYETEDHMQRMKSLSKKIGEKLHLTEAELDELNLLAALHDIGKIALSDQIILKPGKLTKQEWKAIKKHPEIGYRIASQSPELSPIADSILYHHEKWDGSGYPQGLKGEQIPLASRIISVLDAFDAMTHDRPYRKAVSVQQAMDELLKCSGTHFDPRIVDTFEKMFKAMI